jgi:hypothetical protein
MVVAQVSPNSVLSNPSYVNPLAQTSNQTAPAQAAQSAQQAITQTKTDTVTISPQAALMSSKVNKPGEETREPVADKSGEKAEGKN